MILSWLTSTSSAAVLASPGQSFSSSISSWLAGQLPISDVNILTYPDAGSFSLVRTSSIEFYSLPVNAVVAQASIKQANVMTESPLAYFVVTGVVALATSILAILLLFEVLGK